MQYRPLGKSGIRVSEIGLGCEHLQDKLKQQVYSVLDAALGNGINCIDVFMSEPEVRTNIGQALKGRRHDVVVQGHIGTLWRNGQYERSRDPKLFIPSFEDLLRRMQTDYIDIGMLHYVDTEEQLQLMLDFGQMDYAHKLKQEGVIRAIGMSSHSPAIAQKVVEMGLIDVLMMSSNLAFDMIPNHFDNGFYFDPNYSSAEVFFQQPERTALYKACEAHGVGITVMKPLAAGSLLYAQASPFGAALTVPQCLHYVLEQPAVASALVGCKNVAEVEAALAYEEADADARDYTQVVKAPSFSMQGHCMYCNHCLPCPVGIDVAAVHKYYDMAQMSGSPASLRLHYELLRHQAGECIACGSCEKNCPFGVPVIADMQAIAAYFGK